MKYKYSNTGNIQERHKLCQPLGRTLFYPMKSEYLETFAQIFCDVFEMGLFRVLFLFRMLLENVRRRRIGVTNIKVLQ
jgi:hypothetical protein